MGRRKTVPDEELLSIARQAFIEHGSAPSTREIAHRAGVSESVIYQRFRTKEEFFLAAMTPPALDVDGLFRSAVQASDPLEGVESIALGMLAYFRELVPVLVPLVTSPGFDFEEFARRQPDLPLVQLRARLASHFADIQLAGGGGVHDSMATGLAIHTSLFSVAVFELLGAHGGKFQDSQVRAMIRAIWTGVGPGPAQT